MEIETTFLGTASSIPTSKRNHLGILFSFGSENILLDCGEGIQRQFRIAKINPCKLTRILITHWHGDHTLGLPGLLETLSMSEYSKTLKICGPEKTKQNLALLEKIYGRFKLKYEVHELSNSKISEKDFIIESSSMKHGIPTNAYSIKIKDKLRLNKTKLKKLKLPNSPELGKLQRGIDIKHPQTKKRINASSVTYSQKGKKITAIIDTLPNSNIKELAKDSDLLISESSFLSLNNGDKLAKEHKHLTAKQAAQIAKSSNSKKLILTHLSQRYEKSEHEILKEAKKIFKNTTLAKDLDRVVV